MVGKRADSKPWQAGSWRRLPILTVVSLLGSAIGVALAFLVLALADHQPVNSWVVSPTVYLSIITTLANTLLRSAFRSAADIFWWGRLLSDGGVTIQELQGLWQLGSSSISVVKGLQPLVLMRSASVFVLLLAVNGPLTQRAITVELANNTNTRPVTLPVRVEPLWNLTVQYVNNLGYTWTLPPFQPEFAELVADLNQRRPPQLSSNICGDGSSCDTTVTVAGFSRTCTQETISIRGAISLGPAKFILQVPTGQTQPVSYIHTCTNTSSPIETEPYCELLQTNYQMEVDVNCLPANAFNYTSYVRLDGRSETLSVQRCNFTTSFLRVPIRIINGNVVSIRTDVKPSELPQNNVVEEIPAGSDSNCLSLLGGFYQTVVDLYQGFCYYDINENSYIFQGPGPRAYVNSTTVTGRDANGRYIFDMLDPLEDFTTTLNDISLRYAMKTVQGAGRVEQNEASFGPVGDLRNVSLQKIKTPLSKSQAVNLSESTTTPVYRVNYAYAAVAMGVTLLTSLCISVLLKDWKLLGREFSMSPLELAKAFNAPLLAEVGSNSTAAEISQAVGLKRVRYGDVVSESQYLIPPEREPLRNGDGRDKEGLGHGSGHALMVELSGQVSRPRNGEIYL